MTSSMQLRREAGGRLGSAFSSTAGVVPGLALALALTLLSGSAGWAQQADRAGLAPGAGLRASLLAQGWVLRELRWDPVLRDAWAIYADPAHPERPTVGVPAQGSDQEAARGTAEARVRTVAAAAPVIHVGDRVRLWSAERNLRLQLAAVAQDNGAIGEQIRLSIPGAGWDGATAGQQLVRGVVRGVADVEMQP